jgi:NTP pyrophosphatase (non-canonical NTP hydrolase)
MPINYGQALNELANEISDIAEYKGFWNISDDNLTLIPLKLALIHDEVSEALQVHRREYDDADEDPISCMTSMQEDDLVEELADVVIRVLDLSGFYDLDIGRVLVDKIEKNKGRAHRHGKRY